MVGKQPVGESVKIIAQNKKARFDYHIVETFEAGIILTGAEIKSIRNGGLSLSESYVRPHGETVYLLNAHVRAYSHGTPKDYDPIRPRKLLLHRREIDVLRGRVEVKGMTIVPLSLYLKRGFAKLEIALAKGKDAPDKRHTIREKESRRELAREIKSRR